MKLMKQQIERDGSGTITLFPEEPEDMWHAYNLLAPNDLLTASAIRRIVSESATGSTSSHRLHLTLTIRITGIDFDAQAGELHVSGRISRENAHVKIGSHHTLDLELRRPFTLEKSDGWDSVALDVVRDATREDTEACVPAVVLQEGFANICLITTNQTLLKQRVDVSVPKKRAGRGPDAHDAAMTRFYAAVLETLQRHVDLALPRPLLLASPGFVAEGLKAHIVAHATRAADKAVLANAPNFLVVHSSSGHLHSLNEVLRSAAVRTRLSDSKYARETQAMDRFMEMLRRDDGRAWYGAREVERAVGRSAVGHGGGVLLVNNSLFRSQDIGTRKRFVALVDRVRGEGGEARVLSSDHESGKRLEGLGNIAAILTFPLEDLDEEDFEEDEEAAGGDLDRGSRSVTRIGP